MTGIAENPEVPEDGIIICRRCGRRVDLNEADSEAFACECHPGCFFCSHNCLREHLLEEGDDD